MATSIRKLSDMDADRVKFRGQGVSGTATAGTTTDIDMVLAEARLLDGTELLLVNQAAGDSITFQVVDKDNVLGYGAGLVLDQFASSWFVVADKQSQGQVRLPYSAEVPAGIYLRIKYTSTGGTNVTVQCNYFLHKFLA